MTQTDPCPRTRTPAPAPPDLTGAAVALGAPAATGDPVPYPRATLPDLILAAARRNPDAVAVRQWDDLLTYRQLVERAGAVAAVLRAGGVEPGARVGVCGTRRPDLVATIIGVLLAGGCYVPLEPGGPRHRLRGMAADAGVSVVVGDAAVAEFGDVAGVRCLDVPPGGVPPRPAADPVDPADPAYVLFTSGSTGRPKGVLTSHRNVVQFIAGCAASLGAGPGIRTLGIASLSFDAATIDLFVPLALGGSVALLGTHDRSDPVRIQRFIAAHDVNWGFITPTVLSMLEPEAVPGWRVVLCGGEPVPAALAARWLPGRRFINGYGPTETTVFAATGEVTGQPTDPLPIGRPVPNHRAYVVDAHLRPVPAGTAGELLIGGPGVAGGYLNRPELTAQRFVADPATAGGGRLYRTGDLVRQLPDGRLVYLGRSDGQVKIRGQRVELGEVEAVLAGCPGVSSAAVAAVAGPGGTELVALLTPAGAPDDADVFAYLADRLTSGARPARLYRLDALPHDPTSGKLDRAAVRRLAGARTGGAGPAGARPRHTVGAPGPAGVALDPAADPVRAAVLAAWRDAIREPAGAGSGDADPPDADPPDADPPDAGSADTDTDFFLAGGNSISAMRLAAALRAALGRQIDAEDVFAGRTLGGLLTRAHRAAPVADGELSTGNPPTLSPPQRRLWFMDRLAPTSAPYNIALAHRLRGTLDRPALDAALRAVALRHDVLRWRLPQAGGVPYAVCDPSGPVPVRRVDLSGPDGPARLRALLAADAARAFDLETGPAWRVTLYRLGGDEHVLAVTLHHAVFDGWSQEIFYTDLAAGYATARAGAVVRLPPSRATYADYAVWRQRRDDRRGAADLAWWTGHLAGAPSVLDLPRDRVRPAEQSFTGAEATIALPGRTGAAVRDLAAQLGATPAAVLLAGFAVLLHRLTGARGHVLGAVVADRPLAAFDDVIGYFVDTVPIRLPDAGAGGFAGLVRRCAEELRDTAAHPAAPLEQVVTALGLPRNTAYAPLVQVLFNVLNFAEPRLDLAGLSVEPITVDKPGSPFDLTIYVVQRDGGLALDVLYNPDLYDAARITALLADLVDLVSALVAVPDAAPDTAAPHLPRAALRTGAAGATPTAATPTATTPTATTRAATPTERFVADLWCQALERAEVGVTDNFFDAGGDSLALAEIHARLVAGTGRNIRLVDLFRYPTIRTLAGHLDGATTSLAARPDDAGAGPVAAPTGPEPTGPEPTNPHLARAAERAAARRARGRPPHRGGGPTP